MLYPECISAGTLDWKKEEHLGWPLQHFLSLFFTSTFTFSYTELACAIPKAGGGFDYANRALGKDWGFIAGMAQNIEFIFAPPAIAFAIGAYFNLFFPQIPVLAIAIISYCCIYRIKYLWCKSCCIF